MQPSFQLYPLKGIPHISPKRHPLELRGYDPLHYRLNYIACILSVSKHSVSLTNMYTHQRPCVHTRVSVSKSKCLVNGSIYHSQQQTLLRKCITSSTNKLKMHTTGVLKSVHCSHVAPVHSTVTPLVCCTLCQSRHAHVCCYYGNGVHHLLT